MLEAFRHRLPLRVRWAEVDLQGVVFNGHYLTYADVCATEYWRAIGVPYPAGFDALGVDAFVRKATIEYHRPARYDDELLLCGRITRLGRSSAGFAAAMFRADDTTSPLAAVELVYVCVDRGNRPVSWPDDLRRRIRGYEAAAPAEQAVAGSVRIELGDWASQRGRAEPVRFAVFVGEQGVPREMELDEFDAPSLHALAIDADGTTLGTGRLLPDGHIGRMAVLQPARGRGIGSALLLALVEAARARGDREVVLSAQTHALGFYARHGFIAEGETYDDAGIPHRLMRRLL